ncbi:enoyl-CoA hydratase/isomerase family protein [Halioxenophilus sp. WMMB6]|uniref:enoyl-CoA hydratase/isomerase family protein n=1 Tax=Halioxenophilus sp. WMMB6 TaxID=3073815 RepID=UPI00295F1CD0|nr:enoyl-CoA hydratase-related protein [Halioxenophilus sp. WMMB6]
MLAKVSIDEQSRIATVWLNRPEALNTLDVATANAVNLAVMPLADRDDLHCIVLRGVGRAFMAGGDLTAFAKDFDTTDQVINQLLDALIPVIEFLYSSPVPVIACVHGAVAGAGLSLLGACDLVVAAEGTNFLLAYDKIGAPPDCGGTFFLPRLLGERRAASLMLLGESWSAQQALEYGLINKVVAAESFDSECDKVVERVANGPTLAYSAYKRLVHKDQSVLKGQLEAEREEFCRATKSGDFRRGVLAFLNKERAQYQGD